MLVQAVLEGIPDTHKLSAFITMPEPLRELIQTHNDFAMELHRGHCLITNESTGADLKKAITQLDPDKQIMILYNYVFYVDNADSITDTEEEVVTGEVEEKETVLTAEERQLKYYIIKLVSVTFAIIVCMFSGIVIYQYIQGGENKESMIETITATFGEILKFIFGIK
jgi:hypothetical protein